MSNMRDYLKDIDEDLILWDGFDDAIIGLGKRCGMLVVAYEKDKMIDILMNEDGLTYEESDEYLEYNIVGAYVGEKTPIIIETI